MSSMTGIQFSAFQTLCFLKYLFSGMSFLSNVGFLKSSVFWNAAVFSEVSCCFTLESFSIVPLFMSRKLFVYRTNAAVKYLINAAWLFEATPLLLDAPEVVSSVCVVGPLTLLVRNCPSEVQ